MPLHFCLNFICLIFSLDSSLILFTVFHFPMLKFIIFGVLFLQELLLWKARVEFSQPAKFRRL